LAHLYCRSFQPELRRIEIAAIANEHVEQHNAVILAHHTIGLADETLLTSFARVKEHTHTCHSRKEHATVMDTKTFGTIHDLAPLVLQAWYPA
jgi:hypothetical protein